MSGWLGGHSHGSGPVIDVRPGASGNVVGAGVGLGAGDGMQAGLRADGVNPAVVSVDRPWFTPANLEADGAGPVGTHTGPIHISNAPAERNENALFEATARNNITEVANLVQYYDYDMHTCNADGVTPLHIAAFRNLTKMIELLLRLGCDCNVLGMHGDTPLHWAAKGGHVAVLAMLLKAGGDLTIRNSMGMTPIHYGVAYTRTLAVGYLAYRGQNLNSQDNDGKSPLHWVAEQGNVQMAKFLLRHGAHRDIRDNSGETPLVYAARAGQTRMGGLLISRESDYETIRDSQGESLAELFRRGVRKFAEEKAAAGIEKDKVAQFWVPPHQVNKIVLATPAVAIPATMALFYFLPAAVAIVATGAGCYGVRRALSPYWPDAKSEKSAFFIAWFAASFVVSSAVYFWYVLPTTRLDLPLTNILFVVHSLAICYLYAKVSTQEPGTIHQHGADLEYMGRMAEQNRSLDDFCWTCLIRKPLRAKHCNVCDRCVVRFDHHCPWINNCVGVENHPTFVLTTWAVVIGHAMFVYLCYCTIRADPGMPPDLTPVIPYIQTAMQRLPLLVGMIGYHSLNFAWLTLLAIDHSYNASWKGLTTNERANWQRYTYLVDNNGNLSNPFTRGVLFNLRDFLQLDGSFDYKAMFEVPVTFSGRTSNV